MVIFVNRRLSYSIACKLNDTWYHQTIKKDCKSLNAKVLAKTLKSSKILNKASVYSLNTDQAKSYTNWRRVSKQDVSQNVKTFQSSWTLLSFQLLKGLPTDKKRTKECWVNYRTFSNIAQFLCGSSLSSYLTQIVRRRYTVTENWNPHHSFKSIDLTPVNWPFWPDSLTGSILVMKLSCCLLCELTIANNVMA